MDGQPAFTSYHKVRIVNLTLMVFGVTSLTRVVNARGIQQL